MISVEESQVRIERCNPKLNAVLDRCGPGAAVSGPLSGLPVGVKANIAVEGLPWHAGIAAYQGRIAERDAEAVRRLKAAGAQIVASLNMEEGALGAVTDNPHFGRCFNPWGEGLTPGGSSGGSGAAVAAGLVALALGTDTMGSVRIPAAYCGVVGHKPSRGLVSNEGVVALSHTLDHVGPLARSVALCSRALEAMAGKPLAPAGPVKRIGRWRMEKHVAVDPAILDLFEAALRQLEADGCEIVDVELDGYAFGASRRAGLLVVEREGAAIHADMLKTAPEGFSPFFRKMLAWGADQSEEKAAAARAVLDDSRRAAGHAFEKVDIIASPTAAETAFAFGEPVPAGQADITAFADLSGVPAISVPCGLAKGLPAGIQFMAPMDQDLRALAIAARYEALRGPFPAPPGYA
jgi:aspartyl-tRNA(Asn)/glutamyl-tRNA(Gln) amidotransferase subunit A